MRPLPSESAVLLAPEAARLMKFNDQEFDEVISVVEARHAAAAAAATQAMEAQQHALAAAKRQAAKEMGAAYGVSSMPQIDQHGKNGRGSLPSRAASAATTRLAESRSASQPSLAAGVYSQPASRELSRPSTALDHPSIGSSAFDSQLITPATSTMPSRPATGQRLIRNQPPRPGSATRLPAMPDQQPPPPPQGAHAGDLEQAVPPQAEAAMHTAADAGTREHGAEVHSQRERERELRGLRKQNQELEAELRSVKAIAAQSRARLQAFSDSLRSSGLTVPSDGCADPTGDAPESEAEASVCYPLAIRSHTGTQTGSQTGSRVALPACSSLSGLFVHHPH